MRVLWVAAVAALCASCIGWRVGQYHRGYHNFGNDRLGWGAVGEEYVAPLDSFEQECVKKVAGYRTADLRERSGPSFQSAVTPDQLAAIDERLAKTHRFDGTFQRVLAVPQDRMIDEGVGKDAFKFYDFVGARFILGGSPRTAVDLYIAKVAGEPRLVGFQILEEGMDAPTRFLYPESVDAARIRERRSTVITPK
jgi:hypothetical protein